MSEPAKRTRRPSFPDRNRPHFVYSHRNADGEIIYIGLTVNVEKRSEIHRYTTSWWSEVAAVEVEGVRPDKDSGHHLERCLIFRYEPKCNVRHNPAVYPHMYYDPDGIPWADLKKLAATADADTRKHVLPKLRAQGVAARRARRAANQERGEAAIAYFAEIAALAVGAA